jgi:uncharacterized protein (DUF58 family)
MNASAVPRWRPAPRARRLATVALAALALAFVAGHGSVLVLAAGPLVLLALGARARAPARLTLSVTLDAARCLEGDRVTVTVVVHGADAVAARIGAPRSVATTRFVRDAAGRLTGSVVPGRWGVLDMNIRVTVATTHRLRQVDLDLRLDPLTVLPRAPRLRATPAQRAVLARLGEHPSRSSGSGIEFAGIRDLAPGDVLRDLNWSATSRRRRPLVNERAAERAADLVVAIDGFTELGGAEESTVDVAVRGATALTQVALRQRDRVGLIVLGGVLQWLTPASGERHFYRIAEAVLAARDVMFSEVHPDVTRLPRPVLPPGALVVVFSPLVDKRAFTVIEDLRQRRVRTVVVDVLRLPPPTWRRQRRTDPLAVRVWQLDRAADRLALASVGVPVLAWPHGTELQTALAPLRRRP